MRKRDRLFLGFGLGLVAFLVLMLFPFLDNWVVLSVFGLRAVWLDGIMEWVTHIGSGIVVFLVISSLFLYEERKRGWILPLWASFFSAGFIVLLLKILIGRIRPFVMFGLDTLKDFSVWDSSMPSWHAALVFACLPVLDREFRKLKWFWIGFGCLIVFSRLYFGYHYLSDVVLGGMIGYACGAFFVWVKLNWRKQKV